MQFDVSQQTLAVMYRALATNPLRYLYLKAVKMLINHCIATQQSTYLFMCKVCQKPGACKKQK